MGMEILSRGKAIWRILDRDFEGNRRRLKFAMNPSGATNPMSSRRKRDGARILIRHIIAD